MKKIVIVLFAVMTLVSCAKQGNNQAAENIATTKKMFAAFNKHNWEEMAGFYSETAEFLDPVYGTEYVKLNRRQLVEKYTELQQMFPDVQDDVLDIVGVDDKVIVQFISKGNSVATESAQLINLKLPICSILTFADGKIVKDATYYNNQ